MSTRSWIGIVDSDDGSICAAYCHFDGYPSNNGRYLLEFYTSPARIKSLAQSKAFRSLGPVLADIEVYDDVDDWSCLFIDEKEFLETCDEDYTYLYRNNQWYFREGNGPLKPLTMKDCEED